MITQFELNEKLAKLGPVLLKPAYKKKWTEARPTTGYCYLVSEALFHYVLPDSFPNMINLGEHGTHWFLRDRYLKMNGRYIVIDLTGNQFDFEVPYDKARRAAFYKGSVKTPNGFISHKGFLLSKYLKLI